MRFYDKISLTWMRGRGMTLFSAITWSVISILFTFIQFVPHKSIRYEPQSIPGGTLLVVLVTIIAVTGIVLIDSMVRAWYRNTSPEIWERIFWVICLFAVPFGPVLYYWVVYRRLDERGQGRVF
jgi:hypothetical protein